MLRSFLHYARFAREMGFPYTIFRVLYEIFKRTGLLGYCFPVNPPRRRYLTAPAWRQASPLFFIRPREQSRRLFPTHIPPVPEIPFPAVPGHDDWLVSPVNGFRYTTVHWTRLRDFSAKAGDIKDVWEPSRFTFIYPLIRRDCHFGENHAPLLFEAITSWITHNPVNRSPNWVCSQEISIRVLNWIATLYYYKEEPLLTDELLNTILDSIRQQMRHVATNRHFAQVALRNNHTLTEGLCLYCTGLLFPFFPESNRWKVIGKQLFETGLAAQVNEEGAYIQHSMNYHRMVIQLLSWGISVARLNGEHWNRVVYEKGEKTLRFLHSFQDPVTGALPNYGNNDGTLLFPLSSGAFRDYRPQLGALAALLGLTIPYNPGGWQEEILWFTGSMRRASPFTSSRTETHNYTASGYYVLREPDSLLFLRCAAYTHRPFQSDNLHLDLWFNGHNLLRDAGTYRYHTDPELLRFFSGSEGHNTVTVGHFDQMQKGPRFIWLHRVRHAEGLWSEARDEWVFRGFFTGYHQLIPQGITHYREVRKKKNYPEWLITDRLEASSSLPLRQSPLRQSPLRQLWHPSEHFFKEFGIEARTSQGYIVPMLHHGWYSERYGVKTPAPYLEFTTVENTIRTRIFRKC